MTKYGAQKIIIDGITFASQAEGRRYHQLKLLQRGGVISGLEMQPSFEIVIGGLKVCRYVGDFAYSEGGSRVIEDVKGVRTPVFALKKKLMKAVHGIDVKEVRA